MEQWATGFDARDLGHRTTHLHRPGTKLRRAPMGHERDRKTSTVATPSHLREERVVARWMLCTVVQWSGRERIGGMVGLLD